ncbi:hypothetical protein H9P43_007073 [Blastocladiella emersonii ATCC 22665]|nr:hypothetical protein H9P43_007073 [Blastocladiella emersonii ATCC 22665]
MVVLVMPTPRRPVGAALHPRPTSRSSSSAALHPCCGGSVINTVSPAPSTTTSPAATVRTALGSPLAGFLSLGTPRPRLRTVSASASSSLRRPGSASAAASALGLGETVVASFAFSPTRVRARTASVSVAQVASSTTAAAAAATAAAVGAAAYYAPLPRMAPVAREMPVVLRHDTISEEVELDGAAAPSQDKGKRRRRRRADVKPVKVSGSPLGLLARFPLDVESDVEYDADIEDHSVLDAAGSLSPPAPVSLRVSAAPEPSWASSTTTSSTGTLAPGLLSPPPPPPRSWFAMPTTASPAPISRVPSPTAGSSHPFPYPGRAPLSSCTAAMAGPIAVASRSGTPLTMMRDVLVDRTASPGVVGMALSPALRSWAAAAGLVPGSHSPKLTPPASPIVRVGNNPLVSPPATEAAAYDYFGGGHHGAPQVVRPRAVPAAAPLFFFPVAARDVPERVNSVHSVRYW